MLDEVTSLLCPHAPSFTFNRVNRLIVNLDTMVPSYLVKSDMIWGLAKVRVDPAEEETDDVVILEKMPPSSSRKRRARKPRGPVDAKFQRRISRLGKKMQGYKDRAGSLDDEGGSSPVAVEETNPANDDVDQALMPIVPVHDGPSVPAPHLPLDTVQAIGTDFLEMQPQAVSAEAPLASDDD